MIDPNKPQKILLVKLRYIGDTLSLLPVVENLQVLAPAMHVDVLVHRGTEDLLIFHPAIRNVWTYDRSQAKKISFKSISYHYKLIKFLRSKKYDIIIDYTHGDRAAFLCFMIHAPLRITYRDASSLSQLLMNEKVNLDPKQCHIVEYQLAALTVLGLQTITKNMTIHIPESVQMRLEQLLPPANRADRPRIVIHPGAARKLRQWKPERFGVIARRLRETYQAEIILIGGRHEADLVQKVEQSMGFPAAFRSTGLTLLEMAGVLKKSRLLIGNDTAPGHIAAGVDCPSLILFGPTFPHMWRPYHPKSEILFKQLPCCGCRQIECLRPEKTCMDQIEIDEVWRRIQALLEAS